MAKSKKITKDKSKSSISFKFVAVESTVENPTIVETKYSEYVKIGADNKYPDTLLDYYENVGLHKAIILKKISMILGTGIASTCETKSTIDEEFISAANNNETLDVILEKCANDLIIFGGYYLQVIWNKKGDKIAEIYHMPYNKMRSGKANEYGKVEKYYYNSTLSPFAKYTQLSSLTEINTFSITENKKEPQILFTKFYDPSNIYYPMPDYSGAVTDIDTLQEISKFQNTNIKNNFQPGFIIFFRGPEPDEDAKDLIISSLRDKYSGSGNAGKPMVFFLDSEQEAPEIKPMETSDIAEMYQTLMKSVKENIVVSHQVPRTVANLESAGSLGNTKEVLQNNLIFRMDYIKNAQEKLLSSFNMIGKINGLCELEFVNPNPSLLMFGLNELKEILTVDEFREFLGYEALDTEQQAEIAEVTEDNKIKE